MLTHVLNISIIHSHFFLKKKKMRRLGYRHAQREGHIKPQEKDGHQKAKKETSQKKSTLLIPDLGLVASRTVRK